MPKISKSKNQISITLITCNMQSSRHFKIQFPAVPDVMGNELQLNNNWIATILDFHVILIKQLTEVQITKREKLRYKSVVGSYRFDNQSMIAHFACVRN